MGARNGQAFLDRLRQQPPTLYVDGARVEDPTTHPATRNMARSLAGLYDLQFDPMHRDLLTYEENGERYATSFMVPRTPEDLAKIGEAHRLRANYALGFLGRAPDYMNANVMAAGMASDYFEACEGSGEIGSGRNFGENMRRYYEYVRDHDLCLTHALTNPQVNRARMASELPDPYIALGIVRETEEGVVVRGARMLATLPIADEILIFPSTVIKENGDRSRYAIGFGLPTNAPGLSFQCREPFDTGRDVEDHPLSSRFDEQDAFVIFDDVLVPWERVFLMYDMNLANQAYARTDAVLHMAYQVVNLKIAKTEAMLGVAQSIVNTIGSGQFQHVQGKVSELILTLEIMKGLEVAARAGATVNQYGVLTPARGPLDAARNYYPSVYPRLQEIIQLLGASGIIMMPGKADREGPMGPFIEKYLQAAGANAEERLRLFRLAWDMTLSSFGARQNLYEKHFFGDPIRMSSALYESYDKQPYVDRISAFLKRGQTELVGADD
ncbi:4-hydroxyphenylacetate 3-monooxygenase, oxygenase component [Deinococcus maricopensis]|uniref:4-hydroxyphenylacetate 3-monooxygenase, oxygenase subunit n=1 Tax=Deinococcus maricopensis (strain DSM 21211 / LMG 22137 / NRRL B-23946 / LB-34) TaxID=709986 RepID=E8U8Z0_DEIML|nr:4-hydroxyphenylacetate 3-monooxygenase, oxygenase component [Deinococcus maricopensis]ADV67529.1 4-hydroxyphenylacetate 3-monooxygenase, oxygenase subunit [Deinococcus maricopensis DSM 21211]